MVTATRSERIEQIKRDMIVLYDEFLEIADEALRLETPGSLLPGSSKASGLTDQQRARLLRKRRANVAKSLVRSGNSKK